MVIAVTVMIAMAKADVSHLTKSYLPPVQQQTYSVPSVAYSGPSVHQHTTYTAPVNEYLPPVKQSYSSGSLVGYSAPSVETTYSAPAVSYAVPSTAYATSGVSYQHQHQTYSAPVSSVSSEYLPPVQNTYSEHTYSVPQTYVSSVPQSTYYSGSDVSGTQYASNGGYVYRKK